MNRAEALLHTRHARKHLQAAANLLTHGQTAEAQHHLAELSADLRWLEKALGNDGAAR